MHAMGLLVCTVAVVSLSQSEAYTLTPCPVDRQVLGVLWQAQGAGCAYQLCEVGDDGCMERDAAEKDAVGR